MRKRTSNPPTPAPPAPIALSGPAVVWREPDSRGRVSIAHPFSGLNIAATARNLGISRDHLNLLLCGRRQPGAQLAQRLIVGLGVTLADLNSLLKREPKCRKPRSQKKRSNRNCHNRNQY